MSVGQVHKHVADFLHKEGDTPFEQIHFSWQMERVRNIFILLNVHFVIFDQNNCALVVVLAAVVGGTEDGNNRWESLVAAPAMHLVAIDLHLVGADDGNEVVCAQDLFDRFQSEFDRTLSLDILAEPDLPGLSVVHWVGPEQIAQESLERGLNVPIDGVDVGLGLELWRDAAVHAQVVAIHVSSNGHGFKRFNELLVDLLVFELVQNLLSEGEVLGHGPGLVIATKHDDLFGEVELQTRVKQVTQPDCADYLLSSNRGKPELRGKRYPCRHSHRGIADLS